MRRATHQQCTPCMDLDWCSVNPISFTITSVDPAAPCAEPTRPPMSVENVTEDRPLWPLLASKGLPVSREVDPELNREISCPGLIRSFPGAQRRKIGLSGTTPTTCWLRTKSESHSQPADTG